MPDSASIKGTVLPGFEPVRTAFELAVADSSAGGAAVSVMIDGRPVVDLWGGFADARTLTAWTESTASVYYSMTKGLITLIVARLVEAGRIDLDAPMTTYWPEFGQSGKQSITVRQVMSHRAGLSYPVDDITHDDILEWDPIIRLLERQAPLWEPGTAHQYHALTYGWLVGELIQRVTGLRIGSAFETFVAGPAHADAWIGVPSGELSRVARVVPESGFVLALPDDVPHAREIVRSLTLGAGLPVDVAGDGTGLNDPVLQQAAVPGGLGIGTARALARMWSGAIVATADSQPIADAVLDDMTGVLSSGPPLWPLPGAGDETWATGFQVASETQPLFGPSSFGHGGAGGQLSFADRDHRLAFGFLTSDLKVADDFRVSTLIAALHASLG